MPRKGTNIYKRKDGRWEARYEKSRDPKGSIRYGYCYGKTYREAKQKMDEAKLYVSSRQVAPIKASTITVSNVCDEWFSQQKPLLKQSSIIKYENIIKRHIKPELGDFKLSFFTSEICEAFKCRLLKELSAQTVRDILTVLKSVFSYAASNYPGCVGIVKISLPKKEYEEMRVLTIEEQQHFTNYMLENMDECCFGILLAVLTGMRIGEVCALKWKDVSLENKTISIRATMQRLKCLNSNAAKKTEVVIGSPKSEKSLRTIPLTGEAMGLCLSMKNEDPDSYVLTGSKFYMEPRSLQYRLKKITDACNLEGVHFHTLRHTFATRCIEVGFEIKSLSEILGHSNTTITLDRYVHSSMKLKRDNMEKLSILGTQR